MYCKNCGKKVEEGGKFCEYCGYELIKRAEEATIVKEKKEDNESMNEKILRNLIIYIVGFCVSPMMIYLDILDVLGVLILIGVSFWFYYVVYNDAKAIGVNENWWIAVFFLGPIGGILYYYTTKEKRS